MTDKRHNPIYPYFSRKNLKKGDYVTRTGAANDIVISEYRPGQLPEITKCRPKDRQAGRVHEKIGKHLFLVSERIRSKYHHYYFKH